MVATRFDLNDQFIIEQNSRFELYLSFDGDYSNSFLKSEIRQSYGGELVAKFRADPPGYSSDDNKTIFRLYLTAKDTEKIRPPQTHYVWDCVLMSNTEDTVRLMQGVVYISPGVTDV